MGKVTDPRLLAQLNSGQPQMVAPNPLYPLQAQQEQNQAAASEYAAPKAAVDLTRAQTDAHVSQATAPAEIRQKQAGATEAEIKAAAAVKNFDLTGGAGVEQAKSAGFYNRALKSNQMYNGLGVGAPSGGRSVAKALLPDDLVNYFTSPEQQQAEALQRDFIAATLRYESGAAIPPEEFDSQSRIFFPQPGDGPETLRLKQQLRDNAIQGLQLASGPAGEKIQLDVAPPQARQEVATGGIVTENDPELSAAIDRLVRLGRPFGEANAYVVSKGGDPIDPRAYAQAVTHARQNPQYKHSYGSATRQRETTQMERDAGSTLGAYLSGAGTAVTAGFNDELAGILTGLQGGDYTQGRDAFNAGKHLVADAHPVADFAGQVTGGTLGMLMGGAGAAKLAQGGSKVGSALSAKGAVGTDALYGGLYGAGENNQDRMTGATLGTLFGAGGNLAGQGVAKTLAGAISPSGGAMRPLYDLGVRPSLGQRIGGVANAAEERLQSIPVVGDAIAGTRQRARDQYQTGLFNDSLGEIGLQLPTGAQPGHEPFKFAQDAFEDAYVKARSGMVAQADQQLGIDLGNLQRTVSGLREESQRAFDKVWRGSVGRRFASGSLSGSAYKDAVSELGKKVAAIRKNQSGDGELADAFEEAIQALDGSAKRNSPPDAVAALEAADRGYAKLVRLEDAARRAGGDAATFSPSQYNAAVKNTDNSVRNRSYLAGDALNSDIAALGLKLGDVVPNSASFDRAAWAAGVGGLGVLEPTSLLGFGTLGALNAPGVRNVVTGAMAPRGSVEQQQIAELIRRLSPAAGAAGSGTAVGLLPSR